MSFWSCTLIMTRLGPSARTPDDSNIKAIRTIERRNMMEFLLRINNLSRGKCNLSPLGAEVNPWKPLTERRKRNVEEAYLEHGEKWHRNKLPVLKRKPNKVAKVKCEGHLRDRKQRLKGHVFAAAPRLRLALDTVFGRAS